MVFAEKKAARGAGGLNRCGMALRGTVLVALYKALISGQMLHDTRVRNGEASA